MLADCLGRAVAFVLVPGQAHELRHAVALLDRLPRVPRRIVADRGTSSHAFREHIRDLDPGRMAGQLGAIVGTLESDLAVARTQLAQSVPFLSPGSPVIVQIRTRIAHTVAEQGLVVARAGAARKQDCLIDFVPSVLPDQPSLDTPLTVTLSVFLGTLLGMAAISLVAGALRDQVRV